MIDTELLRRIVEEKLEGTDLFVVSVRQSASNEIEVVLDSDTAVGIDACVALSRAVNEAFDRDEEDFELTVASAGIGQPLQLPRQYRKMVGREVEVVMSDGVKRTGTMKAFTDDALTLSFDELVAVEGRKRRVRMEREETIPLSGIKTTRERLTFK